jgi:hypothetical protein
MTQPSVPKPRDELAVPAMAHSVRTGAIGGALGGVTMALVAIGYGLISGVGMWLPVNVIAATFLRDLQSASIDQLAQFNLAALIIGLLMHAVLSIGLGVLFVLILPTLPGTPLIWALTVGPLLWIIATVLTLPMLDPIMARVVNVPSFVIAHVAYGLVMGIYVARAKKVPAF